MANPGKNRETQASSFRCPRELNSNNLSRNIGSSGAHPAASTAACESDPHHVSSSGGAHPAENTAICNGPRVLHPQFAAAHVDGELALLQYWAASRPVARIILATVPARRGCRALRAAWALMCMTNKFDEYARSCRGCGQHPVHTTCQQCRTRWCACCAAWSPLCWKCYRPRPEFHDCGEFEIGHGGPGGNGSLENPL